MKLSRSIFCHLCLIAGIPLNAAGQLAEVQKEEAAIRKSAADFVQAFNRGDAATIASLWKEDAEYTTPDGEKLVGRKAIHELYANLFQTTKGLKLEVEDLVIRAEKPGVAIEEGTAKVWSDGEVPERTRYIARHVKEGGKWKIASVSEVLMREVPSQYEHLKELDWMVGKWADQSDDAAIETTCRWSKNRNFLTRYFTVTLDGNVEHEGMQIIGYDAAAKRIHSWVFDSDGGTGSGIWTRVGNTWSVAATYQLPDGSKGTATNVFSHTDSGDFAWKSINRCIDGESLPDVQLTATRIE